jgi:hypothetical protein
MIMGPLVAGMMGKIAFIGSILLSGLAQVVRKQVAQASRLGLFV